RSRSAKPATQLIANCSGMKIICGVEGPGIVETTRADPPTATPRPIPACRLLRRLPSRNEADTPARKRLIGNVVTRQSTNEIASASSQYAVGAAKGKRPRTNVGETRTAIAGRQNHSVVVGAPDPG